MRKFPSRVLAAVAFVATAASVASCSDSDPVRESAPTTIASLHKDAQEANWTAQAELLADGEVTKEDYLKAFEFYRQCVARLGMTVTEPTTNRADGWRLLSDINFNGITNVKTQEEAFSCSQTQMSNVEVGYEITHTAQMDQALLAATTKCLERQGRSPSKDSVNVNDLINKDQYPATAVNACISSAGRKLYPSEALAITG